MRIIRRIFIAIVAIIVILVAVAYVLPRTVTLDRAITIDAPPEQVFAHVNSMQATEAWSPWLERDPNVVLTYDGPESGVGNTLSWVSDEPSVGNGTQVIVASVENQRVETDLDFGPQGTAKATFLLEPEGAGTRLTWGFVTDLGMNPMARWFGLMLERWIGADYEAGLANLKAIVEDG